MILLSTTERKTRVKVYPAGGFSPAGIVDKAVISGEFGIFLIKFVSISARQRAGMQAQSR
jgi:hypothetical protein